MQERAAYRSFAVVAALALAGAVLPMDGVFGSRLPRCGCLPIAHQSYSKKHINRTRARNAVLVIPVCGSGRAAAAAPFSCLSFRSIVAPCLLLFFCLVRSYRIYTRFVVSYRMVSYRLS